MGDKTYLVSGLNLSRRGWQFHRKLSLFDLKAPFPRPDLTESPRRRAEEPVKGWLLFVGQTQRLLLDATALRDKVRSLHPYPTMRAVPRLLVGRSDIPTPQSRDARQDGRINEADYLRA